MAGATAANAAPGSVDRSFGHNGATIVDLGGHDEATAIALGPRIVVGGTSGNHGALIAELRDGTLDHGFCSDGTTTFDAGASALVNGVAAAPGGAIYVVGFNGSGGFLLKYRVDGCLDHSFSGDGRVDLPNSYVGRDVAVQRDGKIVVAGDEQGGDVHVLRYGRFGGLDPSWSGDGDARVDFGSNNDFASDLVVLADDRILVMGEAVFCPTEECQVDKVALARLTPAGRLSTGFGHGGVVVQRFADRPPVGVGLQGDGSIVVATGSHSHGCPSTGQLTGTIHRFRSDGSLDHGFGTAGSVVIRTLQAADLAVQPDDRILLGGTSCARRSASEFTNLASVARYLPDGGRDEGFGDHGRVARKVGPPNGVEVSAIALQSNGRILAAGNTVDGLFQPLNLAVLRWLG